MKAYYVCVQSTDGPVELLGPYFDRSTAARHIRRVKARCVQDFPHMWRVTIGVLSVDYQAIRDLKPGLLNEHLGLSRFPTLQPT